MSGNDTRGLTPLYRPIATGPEWNEAFGGTARYVDDSPLSDPPAPKARSGNPWIDPETGQRYPGAPGA
jgi:hypothetical protein